MFVSDQRFVEASEYVFQKVSPGFYQPIDKLLELYEKADADQKSSYSMVIQELTMVWIKTISKFHKFSINTRDSIDSFFIDYFPMQYHWELKKIYRDYEEGVLFKMNLSTNLSYDSDTLSPQHLLEHSHRAIQAFQRRLEDPEEKDYRFRFYHNFQKINRLVYS